jgi:hypothetical protein
LLLLPLLKHINSNLPSTPLVVVTHTVEISISTYGNAAYKVTVVGPASLVGTKYIGVAE